MKPDITTKLLLAAIAGGLWALALRPTLAPRPAIAAAETRAEAKAFVSGDMSGVYILDGDRIYRFKSELGKPVSSGTWR